MKKIVNSPFDVNKASLIRYITISVCAVLIVLNWDSIVPFLNKYHLLDKTGHFFGFLFLSWLVDKLLNLNIMVTTIGLIFYSGLTEIGQHMLGFRSGQWSDFIADSLGCLCYLLIVYIDNRLMLKVKK
ncbi:VanZ family protein [Colwelliaceae bacterium BS250]